MISAMLRARGLAVVWAVLLVGGSPALAQDGSWAFSTMVTGPLDRVEACFEELDVPLPGFLQRATHEEGLPFIGTGGLRGDGSLGMSMGPGEPGSPMPGTILFFPVNKDVAPLSQFTSSGAQLLSEGGDTVRAKSTLLRRTPGFLAMAGTEEGILAVQPQAIEERLAAPGLLAEIDIDFKRWRTSHPSSFEKLRSAPPRNSEDLSHSAALGHKLGMRIYEHLERAHLTLTNAGSSLRVSARLDPLAPGELSLPRPAFPRAVVSRFDIAFSSTESTRFLHGVAEEFMGALVNDGIFASAERAGVSTHEVRALFKEAIEIFWIADAVSIGIEPLDGRIAYHQVNQYRGPSDFTARLTAVVKKINAFDKRHRRKPSFVISTYKASGVRITRIVESSGKSKRAMDIAESGTTVRIVTAADTQRRLPEVLELPEEGTFSAGFSGAIDASAAAKAYVAGGGYLPVSLSYWPDSASGQLITWTTRAEGETAVVDVDFPKPVVQVLLQHLGGGIFGTRSSER